MRTRREIKRDIRGMTKAVKDASVADDAERFIELRQILGRLREELADLDAPPEPRPALPPGDGTFTMRQRERTPEEEERLRWQKLIAMRQGPSSMGRVIYDPEGDAHRAARIERKQEHVTGLVSRSAMRAGSPPR